MYLPLAGERLNVLRRLIHKVLCCIRCVDTNTACLFVDSEIESLLTLSLDRSTEAESLTRDAPSVFGLIAHLHKHSCNQTNLEKLHLIDALANLIINT